MCGVIGLLLIGLGSLTGIICLNPVEISAFAAIFLMALGVAMVILEIVKDSSEPRLEYVLNDTKKAFENTLSKGNFSKSSLEPLKAVKDAMKELGADVSSIEEMLKQKGA